MVNEEQPGMNEAVDDFSHRRRAERMGGGDQNNISSKEALGWQREWYEHMIANLEKAYADAQRKLIEIAKAPGVDAVALETMATMLADSAKELGAKRYSLAVVKGMIKRGPAERGLMDAEIVGELHISPPYVQPRYFGNKG